MAGLLEKDFRLMMKRKNYLLMVLAMALILGFSTDGSFIITYITMLGALFTVSTISYDEFDNGYPYLMTLPVTPKSYAVEKYVLGALTGLVTWGFAVALYFISNALKGEIVFDLETLLLVAMAIPVYLLFIIFLIPVELKFGSEKGRIALIVLAGMIAVVVVMGSKFVEQFGVNVSPLFNTVMSLPKVALVLIVTLIMLAAVALSLSISISIMNKKEF